MVKEVVYLRIPFGYLWSVWSVFIVEFRWQKDMTCGRDTLPQKVTPAHDRKRHKVRGADSIQPQKQSSIDLGRIDM